MSRYSSKRQAEVRCADADCITPADHLVMIRGVPAWVCTSHWQERQPRQSR